MNNATKPSLATTRKLKPILKMVAPNGFVQSLAIKVFTIQNPKSKIQNHLKLYLAVAIVGFLTSCTGAGRLLTFPFDPGGRSLNSPASELAAKTNGRYIVVVSDRRGTQDIYLFDAIEQRLIDLPGLNSLDMVASEPDISADGRYIVFQGSREGRGGVYLYDRETRQLRNLTTNLQAEVRNPTISNDGNRIAFEANPNGQWDIFVYDKSGQQLQF